MIGQNHKEKFATGCYRVYSITCGATVCQIPLLWWAIRYEIRDKQDTQTIVNIEEVVRIFRRKTKV